MKEKLYVLFKVKNNFNNEVKFLYKSDSRPCGSFSEKILPEYEKLFELDYSELKNNW